MPGMLDTCPRCKRFQTPHRRRQKVKGGIVKYKQCRGCGHVWNKVTVKNTRR